MCVCVYVCGGGGREEEGGGERGEGGLGDREKYR